MVARQLRWLLSGEVLIYVLLSAWLVARGGWSPLQATILALAIFFGVRLFIVGVTFGFMLKASDTVPAELRLGPVGVLRLALAEYVGFVAFFAVIQPFESFWMAPDRLPKSTGARPPLLLVHGYQCNRGFWLWMRPKLEAAGWTVATINLEPAWAEIDDNAPAIARRIDEILAATGATQVILIGHSMGGLSLRAYLRRYGRDKVARLISLGSPHQGTRLAPLGLGANARQMRVGSAWLAALGAVPLPPGSVSIWSCNDNYVFPHRACSTLEGAANVTVGGVAHLGMGFSPAVLGALLAALDSA
jgi:triacylglycerol esterase/lipase EstA (alpha/beta hydrolase family)